MAGLAAGPSWRPWVIQKPQRLKTLGSPGAAGFAASPLRHALRMGGGFGAFAGPNRRASVGPPSYKLSALATARLASFVRWAGEANTPLFSKSRAKRAALIFRLRIPEITINLGIKIPAPNLVSA